MNIKKRAAGLVAAAGLVSGLFAVGAPAAHAINVATCSGFDFFGTIIPPLPSGGGVDPTPNVAQMKTPNAGVKVWGPGFNLNPLNPTGHVTPGAVPGKSTGSCLIHTQPALQPVGDITDGTMLIGAKLSGKASCDPTSTNTSQYPLNGKLQIKNVASTIKEQAYIRVAGFDLGAGPDVISLTGIDVKGAFPGASLSGEVTFDPVIKALVNDDPVALAQGAAAGVVLKNQYFFDNSQVAVQCAAGGNAIGLIFGTDGQSLLGSFGQPLSFDI